MLAAQGSSEQIGLHYALDLLCKHQKQYELIAGYGVPDHGVGTWKSIYLSVLCPWLKNGAFYRAMIPTEHK